MSSFADRSGTHGRRLPRGRGPAGLPEVVRALEELWSDRGAREAWATALVHAGAHRLSPGEWIIEHPVDWAEAERTAAAAEAMKLAGILPGFVADPALASGLRLLAGSQVLDASPEALVDGDGALDALLAELNEV